MRRLINKNSLNIKIGDEMPQSENAPNYLAKLNEDGISFTDKNGNQLSMVKRSDLMSNGYAILDANSNEVCFITSWSKPAVAISGIPLYASSTTLKIYDHANGVEIGKMAVTAQSISSTKMNLSLLDRRDNILGFISEAGSKTASVYIVKDSAGQPFAEVSVSTSGVLYSVRVTNQKAVDEMVIVKLVAGIMLFNST